METLNNLAELPSNSEWGTYYKLSRPTLHCEGPRGSFCSGGTGVWITRRARYVSWQGDLLCGTCYREQISS